MYDVHVIFDNRPGEQGEIAAALEQAIAAVAATMADPSRVKMLCALMDGRAWTAT
ncbi:transcriptional regulator, partial [Enterobacter hormaechei]|nr:transcriptional regulator [Enterobacter hormaechei]